METAIMDNAYICLWAISCFIDRLLFVICCSLSRTYAWFETAVIWNLLIGAWHDHRSQKQTELWSQSQFPECFELYSADVNYCVIGLYSGSGQSVTWLSDCL